jgi:hypothetical protein
MHACEFCLSDFEARPQVKSPRACPKPDCQRKRQRANERAWHERNPVYSDVKYHQAKREERVNRILAVVAALKRCLEVGGSLLGLSFKPAEFAPALERWFLRLGVRQINKFWPDKIINDLEQVRAGAQPASY